MLIFEHCHRHLLFWSVFIIAPINHCLYAFSLLLLLVFPPPLSVSQSCCCPLYSGIAFVPMCCSLLFLLSSHITPFFSCFLSRHSVYCVIIAGVTQLLFSCALYLFISMAVVSLLCLFVSSVSYLCASSSCFSILFFSCSSFLPSYNLFMFCALLEWVFLFVLPISSCRRLVPDSSCLSTLLSTLLLSILSCLLWWSTLCTGHQHMGVVEHPVHWTSAHGAPFALDISTWVLWSTLCTGHQHMGVVEHPLHWTSAHGCCGAPCALGGHHQHMGGGAPFALTGHRHTEHPLHMGVDIVSTCMGVVVHPLHWGEVPGTSGTHAWVLRSTLCSGETSAHAWVLWSTLCTGWTSSAHAWVLWSTLWGGTRYIST